MPARVELARSEENCQATNATLFYNNARRKVGLVGFWDTVGGEETASHGV
ncbi:MAG: BREX system Lon protease-like protein BrxL [Fimbriimonadaceae bacterium]|nr:BREX system Lon protease-like protein BrxL [Fimbriimonadaceae bacterium]